MKIRLEKLKHTEVDLRIKLITKNFQRFNTKANKVTQDATFMNFPDRVVQFSIGSTRITSKSNFSRKISAPENKKL